MPLVRDATLNDLDGLVGLGVGIQSMHAKALPDLFRDPHDDELRRFLEQRLNDESLLLVAVENGDLVGYLLAELAVRRVSAFRHASRSMYVHQISVDKARRGQQIGHRLMDEAATRARDAEASSIRLDSWSFNTGAHQFFEAEGFAPVNIIFERPLGAYDASPRDER